MPSNLKLKSIRAVKWTFVEAVGLRGIQFFIGIILARLLLPEQFGLIGMLIIFVGVAQVFIDSGFGAAIIVKQDVTQKDINTIFYFNIIVSIIVAVCLCGGAPWVAIFYGQPILKPLLCALSVSLVINSFGLVQNILLRKALNFKTEAKISIFTSLLSGVIGVAMAYRGFGVWSLAAQQISSGIFRTASLWFVSSWRPTWLFSMDSLRGMFGFSSKLLCASLMNTIFDNIYYMVIGKLFSPASLGYYARADNFQKLPSTTISVVILRVVFPIFSTIQNDLERIKRGARMALMILAMINFPMMIGLCVVARPLVIVLLTDKWLPAIPYLQLLCLVGLFYPLLGVNLNILTAIGRSDIYLRLQIINKILISANILLTWEWGIMPMVIGQAGISVIGYLLSVYCIHCLFRYSYKEQLRDIFPYLGNAVLMGVTIFAMAYAPFKSQMILLVSQILVGVSVYFFLSWLFALSGYVEMCRIITGTLPNKFIQ